MKKPSKKKPGRPKQVYYISGNPKTLECSEGLTYNPELAAGDGEVGWIVYELKPIGKCAKDEDDVEFIKLDP